MEKLISDFTKNTIQTAMKNLIHIPHGVVGDLSISANDNTGTVDITVLANEAYIPVKVLEDDGTEMLKHGLFKIDDINISESITGDLTTLSDNSLYLSLEFQKTGVLYNPIVSLIIAETYDNNDIFKGSIRLCTFGEGGKYELNPEAFQMFNMNSIDAPRFRKPTMTELTNVLDYVLLDGEPVLWDDLISAETVFNGNRLETNIEIDFWSIVGDRSWIQSDVGYFCIETSGADPSGIKAGIISESSEKKQWHIYPDGRFFTLKFIVSGEIEDISIRIPGENILFKDILPDDDEMLFPVVDSIPSDFIDQGDIDSSNELKVIDPKRVSVATFISSTTNEQWNVLRPSREAISYNEELLNDMLSNGRDNLRGLVGRGIGEQKKSNGAYVFKVSSTECAQKYATFESIMINSTVQGQGYTKGKVDQVDFSLVKSSEKDRESLSKEISLFSSEFRNYPNKNIVFEKVEAGELVLIKGAS